MFDLVKLLWGRVLCATQGLGASRLYLTKLYMTWLALTCLDLTWLTLTWLDLTLLDLTCLDLTDCDLTWLDLTLPDLTWYDLTWHELTWLDSTWQDLTYPDNTWQNSTCLLYHTSHKSELRKIRTLGSHPKLQIDKLGLLVCSTGASVWNIIQIRVELAEI